LNTIYVVRIMKDNKVPILQGLTKKQTIDVALNIYGLYWCIAAMVDRSIGYYTANTARIAIENYQAGLNPVSERCAACFKSDFELMLTCDFIGFEWASNEKQVKVIEQVKAMEKLSSDAQHSISMLYPTHYYVSD